MRKCQGLIGLLCGHHYEGKYDTVRTSRALTGDETIMLFSNDKARAIRDAVSVTKTYRVSVCIRCGDVINSEIDPR